MQRNYLFKIVILASAIVIGINSSVNAERVTVSDKTVLKQHATLCNQQETSNKQITQDISNRLSLLDKYNSTIKTLQAGKTTQINYLIKNFKNSKKYANNPLKYAEKNYTRQQKQYEKIKFDKTKTAELDRLEKTRNNLIARIDKLQLPFKKKKSAVTNNINIEQKNSELKSLLEPLITPVAGKKSAIINSKHINVTFNTAFVSCHWKQGKKQIAWAHIRIRPEQNNRFIKNKLANKYPISSLSDSSIWLWVGNFNICLVVNNKKLKNKEKVKETLQQLLDLPGFKKISNKKIIKQSIAVYRSLEKIRKASTASTAKLTSERNKLERKISKLGNTGYKSTQTANNIKASLAQAKASCEKYKHDISTLTQLIKLLELPANNRQQAITELKKKSSATKDEILTYCVKIKQDKTKLTKGIYFVKSNRQYQALANKFIRMPTSKEFALINRISTNAWLGTPQITCQWSRDYSTSKVANDRIVFSGKINYNPDYPLKSKGMIDSKYPIVQLTEYMIKLKVGDFIVTLRPNNRKFYNKNTFINAVKEFYNLDAIANALN
jgi:cell division protein FtsB